MVSKADLRENYLRLISLAIEEDIGSGDITTMSVVPLKAKIEAEIVFRKEAVFCGQDAIKMTYQLLSPAVKVKLLAKDGDIVPEKSAVARITGPARPVLEGERIVLNFIARLSGIASLTRQMVLLSGGEVSIMDTRKTVPGWRVLDKYAVSCGGGRNHRRGLYDAIMIKDNHIAVLMKELKTSKKQAAVEAIKRAQTFLKKAGSKATITIEIEDRETLESILPLRPDVIMLDNMSPEQMRRAIARIRAEDTGIKIEISGGITRKNIRRIAGLGADFISIGSLTHSPSAVDVGMDIFF